MLCRVVLQAMKDPLYEPPSTAKDVIEETVKVKVGRPSRATTMTYWLQHESD